jgi:GLPGLI family protein
MNLAVTLYLAIQLLSGPNYQAQYRLTYHPDSTNLKNVKEELFYLTIKENKQSFFWSENLAKADSIRNLIHTGVISAMDYTADPKLRFKTNFHIFIHKNYSARESRVFEKISTDQFEYQRKNNLKWVIGSETDSIAGYACTKATTAFGGREYVAWFTSEIPISDGPYLFTGLPGLIVKISDTRNHYDFSLTQFKAYNDEIKEWPVYATTRGTVETTPQKAFVYREEVRKDFVGAVERMLGTGGKLNGVPIRDPSVRNMRNWDNNRLELIAPVE